MNKTYVIAAIESGTVIDHIPPHVTFKILNLLNLEDYDVSMGNNLTSKKMVRKGIIKISGKELSKEELSKISIIAPDVTVRIIKDYEVAEKFKLDIPAVLNSVIKCNNPNCVTRNEDFESRFDLIQKESLRLKCHFCERILKAEEINLL